MTMKILLTTTSFQDTPGKHHDRLAETGWEIERARGPLPEDRMLELVGRHDGIICGDDAYTKKVLQKCLPKLKVLSKYGIGVDKIDVDAATELRIPVTFCPGVNHTTVAEHAFGLLIGLIRNIPEENAIVKSGAWKRISGHELLGKKMGILGLGRIGREVAKRAAAFEMKLCGFDPHWDDEFAGKYNVERKATPEDILKECDVVCLHMSLSDENRGMVNKERLALMKEGAVIVNTSRGALINQKDVAEALRSGKLAGYATDVVEPEPIAKDNPLLDAPNVVFTPHIGSRTYESVERQAMMAVENTIRVLEGKPALAQKNKL